jgi:serine/threonine protein kinase
MSSPVPPAAGDHDLTAHGPIEVHKPDSAYSDEAPTVLGPTPTSSGDFTRPFLPRDFGDYELLQEVGRGGMGVVYKARQKKLDRIVALKMILPGCVSNPDELKRFIAEASVAAGLKHANIVAVHEVGEVDGQHFYSMDYIDGPSLGQRAAAGPVTGRVAARHVAQMARAIDHAHRHGILHRDLKPSNVLLDKDDQPHITDFGLAKRLQGDPCQTRTGAVMGTPSYMAPEQAAGKNRNLGPCCDVYSLGAVLYDLLTGRPPFRSDTPLETIVQVMERDPAPPRLLNGRVEQDLETICLKCLEKDPAHRYVSAAALAEDLERFLHGDRITARSFNVLDRIARTLDRSHHAVEFRSWGSMLLIFGLIVFVGHALTFLLVESVSAESLHWASRLSQFAVMGLVFWRYRRGSQTLLPTTAAERQLWSIWLGYLGATAVYVLASRVAVTSERRWDELSLYPVSAILTGMAFFVMGSSYWGQCYTLGLSFFGVAALMPLTPRFSPLEFGTVWAIAFLSMGLHLRRLADEGTIELPIEEWSVPAFPPEQGDRDGNPPHGPNGPEGLGNLPGHDDVRPPVR